MPDYPLITIGMTCFNAEDTIEGAIDSALSQDYPNTEIIIVDDFSCDSSIEKIKLKVAQYPQIQFIQHKKNTGVAEAHNTIIKHAQGNFIATFDDDDISHPSRVSKQYDRIIRYESEFSTQLVICHTARIQTYNNNMQRYEKTIGTDDGISPNGKEVASRILCGHLGKHKSNIVGSCANCSRMIRTNILKNLNGYDAIFKRGEDTDLAIRFALLEGHFVGVDAPLVHQKMTKGNEKTLQQENKLHKQLLTKHKDFLNNIGWYSFMVSWHDIRYAYLENKKIICLIKLIRLFLRHPIKAIQKILWSLPASDTRNSFKNWHEQSDA